MRSRFKDLDAISSRVDRAASSISNNVGEKLELSVSRLAALNQTIETRLAQRFDSLEASMRLQQSVDSVPEDETIETEAEDAALSPKTRLDWANQVRNAIVGKWLDGRTLTPTAADPHELYFEGHNEAGSKYRIHFRTPYRRSLGQDGSLPFTAELWVDDYKKLNFEWDSEGNYKLRGFRKGDWFADVADWNLSPTVREQRAA